MEGRELSAAEAAEWFGAAGEPDAGTRPRLPAAYTSFDGDHVADVTRMCLACTVVNHLPLNPEAVLGYYVSTTSLGNRKPEVMKACLAVEFKADELWLVTRGGADALGTLPEGVRAEYLLWREFRPEGPVRHLPWLGDSWRDFLLDDSGEPSALAAAELTDAQHEEILQSMSDAYRRDLEDRLLEDVRRDGLPPVVFLSSAEHDDKHLDWARKRAYEARRVGFSPSTMVPKIVADVMELDLVDVRYIRDEIIARCDEFWLFAKPAAVSARDFSPEVIADAWAWMRANPEAPIRVLTWGEVGVPKYDPDSPWGLTDEERDEDGGPDEDAP